MRRLETIGEVRAWRAEQGVVGFVPTMGFLHDGHLDLVRRAKAACGVVVASIFVNPMQFAPGEDLDRYPRDEAGDWAKLAEAGCDAVFMPTPDILYRPGFDTRVVPGAVARPLEGAIRPGHFDGVATVVLKLFNIVQPTAAWFGQKDAQQVAVLRAMVRDLDVPVRLEIAPTVREADGLALSSRNSYLSPEDRAAAPVLHRALTAAAEAWATGERDADGLRATMSEVLAQEPLARPDYVSLADPDDLSELQGRVAGGALASLAVRIGRTRLIDNAVLD